MNFKSGLCKFRDSGKPLRQVLALLIYIYRVGPLQLSSGNKLELGLSLSALGLGVGTSNSQSM